MKRIDRASNNDRVNLEMKAKVRNSAQSIIVFFFLICYCVVGNAEGFVGRMFRLPGQLTRSTSIICFRTDFPFIVLCYKCMICFHPKIFVDFPHSWSELLYRPRNTRYCTLVHLKLETRTFLFQFLPPRTPQFFSSNQRVLRAISFTKCKKRI